MPKEMLNFMCIGLGFLFTLLPNVFFSGINFFICYLSPFLHPVIDLSIDIFVGCDIIMLQSKLKM